jgi:transposase-like protein
MTQIKVKRFAHTGRRPNDDRRQAVLALYQSGLSIRDVGILIGVTPQAVHSMLQRMGAPRRPRGGNKGGHSRHRR